MDRDSNNHAIIKGFTDLKDKESFIKLTKHIIELQQNNKINFFKKDNIENLSNLLRNEPLPTEHYYVLGELYEKNHLFLEVKKLSTKITKIKNIDSMLFENYNNKEEIKNFTEKIVLVNLIRKRLSTKSRKNIIDYDLLKKIADIRIDLANSLNLTALQNFSTHEEISDFINNNFNYSSAEYISFKSDEYERIYELFYLFM